MNIAQGRVVVRVPIRSIAGLASIARNRPFTDALERCIVILGRGARSQTVARSTLDARRGGGNSAPAGDGGWANIDAWFRAAIEIWACSAGSKDFYSVSIHVRDGEGHGAIRGVPRDYEVDPGVSTHGVHIPELQRLLTLICRTPPVAYAVRFSDDQRAGCDGSVRCWDALVGRRDVNLPGIGVFGAVRESAENTVARDLRANMADGRSER